MILIEPHLNNPFSLNLGLFAVILVIFAEASLTLTDVRVIRD